MSLSTPRSSPPPRSAGADSGAGGVLDSEHLDSSDSESRQSSAGAMSEKDQADSDHEMDDGEQSKSGSRRSTRTRGSPTARVGEGGSSLKRPNTRKGLGGGKSGGRLERERERSGLLESERVSGSSEKLLDRDYPKIEFDPFKELQTASLVLANPEFEQAEIEAVAAAEASAPTAVQS